MNVTEARAADARSNGGHESVDEHAPPQELIEYGTVVIEFDREPKARSGIV